MSRFMDVIVFFLFFYLSYAKALDHSKNFFKQFFNISYYTIVKLLYRSDTCSFKFGKQFSIYRVIYVTDECFLRISPKLVEIQSSIIVQKKQNPIQ